MIGNAIIDRLRRWRSYRRTVSELSKLQDRELDDLGISRNDIYQVARDHSRPKA